MTDLERIGQRLVTGFPGTALTPELVQVVKEYKIGNIILFRENIASADQLRTLCADLQTLIRSETGHDAFIMIDQEGGAVTRLTESCIMYQAPWRWPPPVTPKPPIWPAS